MKTLKTNNFNKKFHKIMLIHYSKNQQRKNNKIKR